MFLEISQNSQENTCARVSFLIKLQVSANKEGGCQYKKGFYLRERGMVSINFSSCEINTDYGSINDKYICNGSMSV